ncbi:MAG: hypothetical protein ACFFA7_17040 [Promethearchaeota archaeon]
MKKKKPSSRPSSISHHLSNHSKNNSLTLTLTQSTTNKEVLSLNSKEKDQKKGFYVNTIS